MIIQDSKSLVRIGSLMVNKVQVRNSRAHVKLHYIVNWLVNWLLGAYHVLTLHSNTIEFSQYSLGHWIKQNFHIHGTYVLKVGNTITQVDKTNSEYIRR